MVAIIFWTCILLMLFLQSKSNPQSTLKLVQIVLRHGDRSPLNEGKILTDIIGASNGELTKKGIERSLLLGQWIQYYYGCFIGPYSKNLVEAISTSTSRTQETLKNVFQGLFLRDDSFEFTTLPLNSSLFMIPNLLCINFSKYHKQYTTTIEYQELLKKYDFFNQYLQETINEKLPSIGEIAYFYDDFTVQKEVADGIPRWVDVILPQLETAPEDYFKSTAGNKVLRQIIIGSFFKKVIESSNLKFNDRMGPTKMFLYSVHDLHIYTILSVLGNTPKIRPQYCSHIAIEAHTIDGVDGLKIFYRHNPDDNGVALNIANCGLFCPLSNFTETYKEYFHEFETC